jgi:sec-independent protein translocase protein TatA
MLGLGPLELLLVLGIVVVLFGASRLPQIGKGLGEGIKNFRSSMREAPQQIEANAEKRDSPPQPRS